MAQSLAYLSAYNGFVPQATNDVIAFVRNEGEFPLNRYITYRPAKEPVFEYTKLETDEFVRVQSYQVASPTSLSYATPAGSEFAWEDGDDRPTPKKYGIRFTTDEGRCYRNDYAWVLGYGAIDNTTLWKPKPAHMAMALSKAMTVRTLTTATLLQTTAYWPSNNVADVNTLNGGRGKWPLGSDDPNSPNYLAIFSSLISAAQIIHLLTNGKVRVKDLVCVVSPRLAIAMAKSAEMLQYVRQTPQAINIIKEGFSQDDRARNDNLWTLPETYKGFKFVVEDSPYVQSGPNFATYGGEASISSTGRQYIWNDASPVLISRKDGIDGEMGAPAFSTVTFFHHDGLAKVKVFDDPKNERVDGHVEEKYCVALTAGLAGMLMTNAM